MERWLRALQASWLDRLQSRLVLPTARTLYLFGAILCIVAALGGLLGAFLFQLGAWQPAMQKELPEIVASRPEPIAFDRLDRRLAPPSNVRFVVDVPSLPLPLSGDVALGHFEADTPNGLAAFPDGFQIIGGRDADHFKTGQTAGLKTALFATAALVDQVNTRAPTLRSVVQRRFAIQILARDVYENKSASTIVNFTLSYGPRVSAPAPASIEEEGQPISPVLKKIAIKIAGIVDPTHSTPDYFDSYHYAVAEPDRCDASGNDRFIDGYRRALDYAFPRLSKERLTPFYVGLCEAWKDSIKQGEEAAATSMADRQRVMAENAAEQIRAEVARSASRIGRDAALLFAAGAIFAFMTIALFLAFLALEGHSNAVRQAIELLAAQRSPQETQPSTRITPARAPPE